MLLDKQMEREVSSWTGNPLTPGMSGFVMKKTPVWHEAPQNLSLVNTVLVFTALFVHNRQTCISVPNVIHHFYKTMYGNV